MVAVSTLRSSLSLLLFLRYQFRDSRSRLRLNLVGAIRILLAPFQPESVKLLVLLLKLPWTFLLVV
jgi:hypothetical protein